jgi:hypothetical protein
MGRKGWYRGLDESLTAHRGHGAPGRDGTAHETTSPRVIAPPRRTSHPGLLIPNRQMRLAGHNLRPIYEEEVYNDSPRQSSQALPRRRHPPDHLVIGPCHDSTTRLERPDEAGDAGGADSHRARGHEETHRYSGGGTRSNPNLNTNPPAAVFSAAAGEINLTCQHIGGQQARLQGR